jgi:hypothetical protein
MWHIVILILIWKVFLPLLEYILDLFYITYASYFNYIYWGFALYLFWIVLKRDEN